MNKCACQYQTHKHTKNIKSCPCTQTHTNFHKNIVCKVPSSIRGFENTDKGAKITVTFFKKNVSAGSCICACA